METEKCPNLKESVLNVATFKFRVLFVRSSIAGSEIAIFKSRDGLIHFGERYLIHFSFIYIALNHNNSCLKVFYTVR